MFKLKKTFSVILALITLLLPTIIEAASTNSLIFFFATAHLNKNKLAVKGVVVTPGGEVLTTNPLSSYNASRIILENPEAGTYQAFYEAVIPMVVNSCYTVGGIEILLTNKPAKVFDFLPAKARIPVFRQDIAIQPGTKTYPIGSFVLTADDLAN